MIINDIDPESGIIKLISVIHQFFRAVKKNQFLLLPMTSLQNLLHVPSLLLINKMSSAYLPWY